MKYSWSRREVRGADAVESGSWFRVEPKKKYHYMKADSGAYVLRLELGRPARLTVGVLGELEFEPGRYFYVGSARRGIKARVARHKRLVDAKSGVAHWHIDYLLLHPHCRLVEVELLPGAGECRVARSIGRRNGVTIPVPGFGATDCRSGCRAHLFFQISTQPAI